jgi:hypothetical protein
MRAIAVGLKLSVLCVFPLFVWCISIWRLVCWLGCVANRIRSRTADSLKEQPRLYTQINCQKHSITLILLCSTITTPREHLLAAF